MTSDTPSANTSSSSHEPSSSNPVGSGPLSWPRRLYDWTLSWADHPYGFAALCVLALVEAVIFPIPPDVLLIALVLGARERWFRLALGCTLASMAGGLIGYGLGSVAWSSLSEFFYHYIPGFTEAKFQTIEAR